MENLEYKKSLYQVSEIMKYISPDLRSKIPNNLISYIEKNKAKDYNWEIDKKENINNQEILPIAKQIISIIYMDYLCNEEEKNQLEKIWKENQAKSEIKEIDYEFRMVIYKDSIFKRAFNKLRFFFKRNKKSEIQAY